MKRFLLGLGLAMTLATTAALADPAHGIWQTEPDDGAFALVELEACGSAVCGTIIRTFNEAGEYRSPNIGRQLVIDMVPQGNGRYEGSVWRPSNDRIYIGRMQLEQGNTQLALRGCVAGGLFCARQNWVRVR